MKCTYHDDVGATLLRGSKGSTFGEPVAIGIVLDPLGDDGHLLLGEALVGIRDSLQDVVHVLGASENSRSRLRDFGIAMSAYSSMQLREVQRKTIAITYHTN